MTEFKKYMHLERYGNDEVQGIELGTCYVFPKIDGTNASVWRDDNGGIQAGSRNRHLSLDNDNAGFCEYITGQDNIHQFFSENAYLRLYGEWLVPHSLKTYRDDAWRKFYVFDVFSDLEDRFLTFGEYEPLVVKHGLEYIPCVATIKNASYDSLLAQLDKNGYLISDGEGVGEGIVIKNYDFVNKFGRNVYAKLITNAFKEKHVKEMGGTHFENKLIEQDICNDSVTRHLVEKVYSKIVTECEGWNSRYIPRLLNTVYHDVITEELWSALKSHKSPIINFKTLNRLCMMKTKELMPELF